MTGLMKKPVPRSNPAVSVRRGVISRCQWYFDSFRSQGAVDVIVEGRVVEDPEHPAQGVLQDPGEGQPLVIRDILERHLVGLREDPSLEWEPGRIWGEADEGFVLRYDSFRL